MALKASYKKYTLRFKQASGTSRGILREKESWFLFLIDEQDPGVTGVGECGLLKGLSIDDRPDYEEKLQWLCTHINRNPDALDTSLEAFPSIRFGLEMALTDLTTGGNRELFPSDFTASGTGIPINGLIWMGDVPFMKQQIREKLERGFRCIKMKIGAIDFEKELELLAAIRKEYGAEELELRVDANGAFAPEQALERLKCLSELELHSIEQPIKARQWEAMALLCEQSPLPVALDEELIGIAEQGAKESLLEQLKPPYIILKPSLLGGFKSSEEWISLAEKQGAGWWITSALESNIGLNALAQWTYTLNNPMPQGLGTGSLYINNIGSPLYIEKEYLHYRSGKDWDFSPLTGDFYQ